MCPAGEARSRNTTAVEGQRAKSLTGWADELRPPQGKRSVGRREAVTGHRSCSSLQFTPMVGLSQAGPVYQRQTGRIKLEAAKALRKARPETVCQPGGQANKKQAIILARWRKPPPSSNQSQPAVSPSLKPGYLHRKEKSMAGENTKMWAWGRPKGRRWQERRAGHSPQHPLA